MANQNATQEKKNEFEKLDFDELERLLQEGLENELIELDYIDKQKMQIGSPDALGKVVLNTVWEQFTNQIAIRAGEDFIKANNGLTLDLRDEAHIQTTENFANGKIATHNTEINYQKRYDNWQSNFKKDEAGNIITHKTRTGKEEATLVSDARKPFDKNRPKGSKENHTQMDHTVSAAEIIRDAEANAHMTQEEQVAFANSKENLNEMDSSLNQSKGDKSMTDWLDNPNAKGQKPSEIFDISEEEEQRLREKDAEARAEYEKQKKAAEERSIKAGKASQKAEAFRIGKKAARAVIMNLLAGLIKKIAQKFISWLKNTQKTLKTLLVAIRDAIVGFIIDLKTQVISVVDSAVTVIASSILGPVISVIKKAWMLIKQGWNSLKEAINYINDPKNKNQPISIMMMEVGKIIMAGMTAVSSIVLGEVIEAGLTTIPIFSIEIPLFGSLANVIGIFMGAMVSGIIGALAIELLNRMIAKKQTEELVSERIEKGNVVLNTQYNLLKLNKERLRLTKYMAVNSIDARHEFAAKTIKKTMDNIMKNDLENNEKALKQINRRLDKLLLKEK